MNHCQRTVYGWPSFLTIGVRQFVRSNAYYVAILVVPLLDLPMAQTSDVPEHMIETSRPTKQWAWIVPQGMKKQVIDTRGNQVAHLQV